MEASSTTVLLDSIGRRCLGWCLSEGRENSDCALQVVVSISGQVAASITDSAQAQATQTSTSTSMCMQSNSLYPSNCWEVLAKKRKSTRNWLTCYLTCVFPEAFIETRLALRMLVWPFEVCCRGENTEMAQTRVTTARVGFLLAAKLLKMPSIDDHVANIWRAEIYGWLLVKSKDAEMEYLLLLTKWWW